MINKTCAYIKQCRKAVSKTINEQIKFHDCLVTPMVQSLKLHPKIMIKCKTCHPSLFKEYEKLKDKPLCKQEIVLPIWKSSSLILECFRIYHEKKKP